MARKILKTVIFITIAIWIYLVVTKESHSKTFMLIVATLTFLVFSFSVLRLIVRSTRPPATKGELISFPLLMWVLWAMMFLLFVFLLVPVLYPDLFALA